MPPASEGDGLAEKDIALLRAWIDQGASGPADEKAEPDPREHWAFRAPVKPTVPGIKDLGPKAESHRRLPWPGDGKTRPQAAAAGRQTPAPAPGLSRPDRPAAHRGGTGRLRGRQLSGRLRQGGRPAAGSRSSTASAGAGTGWTSGVTATGGAWVPRCATARNTSGTGATGSSKSLNADKGYDQMVREMLAADELYPNDLDRLRATGFLVRPLLHLQPQYLAR